MILRKQKFFFLKNLHDTVLKGARGSENTSSWKEAQDVSRSTFCSRQAQPCGQTRTLEPGTKWVLKTSKVFKETTQPLWALSSRPD